MKKLKHQTSYNNNNQYDTSTYDMCIMLNKDYKYPLSLVTYLGYCSDFKGSSLKSKRVIQKQIKKNNDRKKFKSPVIYLGLCEELSIKSDKQKPL